MLAIRLLAWNDQEIPSLANCSLIVSLSSWLPRWYVGSEVVAVLGPASPSDLVLAPRPRPPMD